MRRVLSLLAIALCVLTGCDGETEPELPAGYLTLAEARGDFDGDGHDEVVRLVGRGAADSPFRDNLSLLVGSSPDLVALPPAASGGYAPTLQLADVTGDGACEVLVVADTGGSGGMVGAVVLSPSLDGETWHLLPIFDSEAGPLPKIGGELERGFAARLDVTAPGLSLRSEVLDLAARRDTYLQTGVYGVDGDLEGPVAIWGGGLMALSPAPDPGLQLVQQARGSSNADRLAEIRTVLKWQADGWQTTKLEILPLPQRDAPQEQKR